MVVAGRITLEELFRKYREAEGSQSLVWKGGSWGFRCSSNSGAICWSKYRGASSGLISGREIQTQDPPSETEGGTPYAFLKGCLNGPPGGRQIQTQDPRTGLCRKSGSGASALHTILIN